MSPEEALHRQHGKTEVKKEQWLSIDAYLVWTANIYYKNGQTEKHDIILHRSSINNPGAFAHLLLADESNVYISADSIQAIVCEPKTDEET